MNKLQKSSSYPHLFLWMGLLSLGVIFPSLLRATELTKATPDQYIQQYKDLAIREMRRSGIPASITLAQGLLESGNGNSKLASEGNNHFGIKCKAEWKGESMKVDDDAPQECFRVYPTAEESYRDHTDFLMTKSRYHFLFEYEPNDYKNWAYGLKEAKYATNPAYPRLLISLIERYALHFYDDTQGVERPVYAMLQAKRNGQEYTPPSLVMKMERKTADSGKYLVSQTNYPIVNPSLVYPDDYEVNGARAYVLKPHEDIQAVSNKTGILAWQILEYNDLSGAEHLEAGTILYLEPKKKEAKKPTHTVQGGENMYFVSQLHHIKLSRLYKLNKMEPGEEPLAGEILFLKEKRIMPPKLQSFSDGKAMAKKGLKYQTPDIKIVAKDPPKEQKNTDTLVAITSAQKIQTEIQEPYHPTTIPQVDTSLLSKMEALLASIDNIMLENTLNQNSVINLTNSSKVEHDTIPEKDEIPVLKLDEPTNIVPDTTPPANQDNNTDKEDNPKQIIPSNEETEED